MADTGESAALVVVISGASASPSEGPDDLATDAGLDALQTDAGGDTLQVDPGGSFEFIGLTASIVV